MVAPALPRKLDPDRLARELGNWRTAGGSGPVYRGLADGIRLLIIDGRLPVGAQLPSERVLADALHVSRTTVTSAYTQLGDDGYLHSRPGARSITALPVAPPPAAPALVPAGAGVNLAAAAMAAPAAAVLEAVSAAANEVAPYLNGPGLELAGVAPLREAIARRYCRRGLPTTPDEIMVTSGALQAIGLILTTFIQPGDRVLVEQPTFHGALAAIATAGARPVPVALNPEATEDVWDLDAFQFAMRQLAPNLAYLMPDNHNPVGLTMPAPSRNRLAQIIAETRTRTIVDETMVDMWIDEPVPPPLAASMTNRHDLVLTIGSMSKSFWGGLRIGWIRAEKSTLATLAAVRPSIDLGTPILEQLSAAKLLAMEDTVLPERREIVRAGRTLVTALLAEQLPDWRPVGSGHWPAGGLALWIRLPAPMSSALSAAASRLGVDLPPGPRFGVDGTLERYIRVPYTLPADQLRGAIELLARAWHSVTGGAPSQPGHVVI
ncbi:PLP-dependent aminotransferase family protein [Mycolicibacterium komossense]|uniref:PLP-dependent aminotransferase family protein n=1 Tax=Mycolicibacterium komossense TaxID=1779 RepID=A0ABT3CGF5_9MYCO|nr:PLP-dependent aminotransferase family protein [Mycolicibacterium komossense]MCV7228545.1 PLP-dependent aminotransferase family protein [Mycolicibacterium komossense]